jgi:hypothetical protein
VLSGPKKGTLLNFPKTSTQEKTMFDDSCFTQEVIDFRKLRTGHKQLKVFAVDENRKILFVAKVFQNRPLTTGKLRFDNGKSFDLQSRMIGNQKVSLFRWSEELERRLRWQNLMEEIRFWLEKAKPEDVVVFGDFVGQEAGRRMLWNHPSAPGLAKEEIMKRLQELGFVQLQRLAGMLYVGSDRVAA